jgi:lipopolysaccharide export LptBFGC system permease protein LptF
LPSANVVQEDLRAQIRGRGVAPSRSGRQWVATDQRIYSYEQVPASDNERAALNILPPAGNNTPASDNVKRLFNLVIYDFDKDGRLQLVYRSGSAIWEAGRVVFEGRVEKSNFNGGTISTEYLMGGEVDAVLNPFRGVGRKPSQLTSGELKDEILKSGADVERRSLEVPLQNKYAAVFLPFIIALFTAPFALSLSRKGKVVTVGYAIGLWLVFTGVTSIFGQIGLNGGLSPEMAVWSPLVLFFMLGIYLLSKIRT